MNADLARQIARVSLQKKKEEEAQRIEIKAKEEEKIRNAFPEAWAKGATLHIEGAAEKGGSSVDIEIINDLDYKRGAIRTWADMRGFKVIFGESHYAGSNRDNETGQEFGDYWFQWVTVSW